MEVRPGYKQTEVGVIPEEWDVAPLGKEIERLDAGVSVNSVDEVLRSFAHEPAVLKTSAISGGRFLPDECKKIVPRDIARAKLNPRFDTLLISRMNTPDLVGECGYVYSDFPNLFLPDRLWMSRSRSGSEVCIRWLNYLLSSTPYKTRINGLATGTSGSMKNIAKDSLLAMPIAFPKPAEQRAIATALSDMDALLDGLDRLIAKKRDLKQAAMQQLLTGQTRLPGFTGAWEVKRLGDIAEIRKGELITSDSLRPGSIPVIAGGKKPAYFHDSANRFGRTITISASGANAGYVALYCEPIFASDCSTISEADHYSIDFLYYLLSSKQEEIYKAQTGGAQPHIHAKDLSPLIFPLPVQAEQSTIATVLSDMDAEIAALEARREKTRDLKQGMVQELLTGRTRLV